jgi:D-3-phosphoglycerate dehydrogenase
MTARVLITDHAGATADIEREVLAAVGAEVVVATSTDTGTLKRLAADADAIMTCFAQVTSEVLSAAPHCKTVARSGVGLDNIDVASATKLGIVVSNVPEYCTEEVADHALTLTLALARRLVPLARETRQGGWDRHLVEIPMRLRGRVMGLVGMGAIGRALVPRVQALGMEVIALQRSGHSPKGVRRADSLSELLAAADVVSLHLPLTEQTRGLIGAHELALMKPTSLLINTARGGLVDTDALTAAIAARQIGGAGLDVTEPEPLPAQHPLRGFDNVVITPHSAFSSSGSMADLSRLTAENVAQVLRGDVPQTAVNREVLDLPGLRVTAALR